jgi:hypothetical protein
MGRENNPKREGAAKQGFENGRELVGWSCEKVVHRFASGAGRDVRGDSGSDAAGAAYHFLRE